MAELGTQAPRSPVDAQPTSSPASPEEALKRILAEVASVFKGSTELVELALVALLAGGHLLIEDVPGVGKTTLAHALARATGLDFRRVQFTADLLPSDVLGGAVYDPQQARFQIRTGPVFTNVLLADEINRAPPRTQSGLLQAMEEREVSIDGETLPLPRPFLVVATQNPHEHHGTYPLPESQLDRFLMRLTIGYPDADAERKILEAGGEPRDGGTAVAPVLEETDLLGLQRRVESVHMDGDLIDYLMTIVRATREDSRLRMGVSPRGAVGLLRAAKAHALVKGRDFVIPLDIQELVGPCLAHRVVAAGSTAPGAEHERAEAILAEVLASIPVPV